MILEFVRYGLSNEAQAAAFQRDYAQAAVFLDASPHCRFYRLSRCVEDPLTYILIIGWTSQEAHLQGFRLSPEFSRFLALVGPYRLQLLEMRHYDVVDLPGAKNGIGTE